eukprot:TRINITY_DN15612_c0_g1_i2.p1 TRINITY_DN15612_c0_g1~~TRINITY_DN15612_c0_g1_i2.p1  ORF type:complete len:576 (+),score=109.17 TRINITY_DN15612_c0_g1_i2:70-1728(+)
MEHFDHAAAFSELKTLIQNQEENVAQNFKRLEERLDVFLKGPLIPLPANLAKPETVESPKAEERKDPRPCFRHSKTVEEEQLKRNAESHHELVSQEMPDRGPIQENKFLTLVEHPAFEIFFGIAITSNALILGFEVSAISRREAEAVGPFFLCTTFVYAFLFGAELVLRLLAYGKSFFFNESWQWNCLDCVIVAGSLWDVIVEVLNVVEVQMGSVTGLAAIRVVRVLRITRMVRIVKVARIMRFVKALRTLLASIVYTIKSLWWALVLLVLLVYVFGILFTQAVLDYTEDNEISAEAQAAIDSYWSDLLPSMLTLFMSITDGVEWEYPLRALAEVHQIWVGVFLFYIAFAYLAVLNVVTGVFCEAAIESAANDHEMAMHAIMENRKAHINKVKSLFQDLDEDGSGTLTLAELEHHMSSDAVKDYFEMLELDVRDAWSLFKLLDQDGGSAIELEEFLWGCMHLRGNAKALDLARLQHDHKWLLHKLTDFMAYSEEQFQQVTQMSSLLLRIGFQSVQIQSQSAGLQNEWSSEPEVQPSSPMPLFANGNTSKQSV